MHLSVCRLKEWDDRHAAHAMLQALVAQSVEHDKAFAATRKNAWCMLIHTAPKQLDMTYVQRQCHVLWMLTSSCSLLHAVVVGGASVVHWML